MMSVFDRMWAVILQSNLYYMAPLSKGKSGQLMDSGFCFKSFTDNFVWQDFGNWKLNRGSLLNPAID